MGLRVFPGCLTRGDAESGLLGEGMEALGISFIRLFLSYILLQ